MHFLLSFFIHSFIPMIFTGSLSFELTGVPPSLVLSTGAAGFVGPSAHPEFTSVW